MHNNTQGNQEVQARQQPPNAATPSEPSANTPLPLQGAHVLHKGGGCASRAGRCQPRGWQQGRDQPTTHGTVHVVRRCEILVRGGRQVGQEGVRERGTQERLKRSNTDTQNAGATPGGTRASTADKEEGHSKAGEATRTAGTREPEWSGWESVCMAGSNNTGDGLASQPRRHRVPGQPLLYRHQVGGVSRSPDGLFAQQEREPIRGRPTVRGKSTYGGRPGQHVEEQGTWALRTQKHSGAGYGRPVDRGAWAAKTVKRPRQQPAHPQYANYRAPLTRKRHILPHPAQPQHTSHWAPRTRKRHQQEHRPQRPTESSDPTQHAKGRTGECPGLLLLLASPLLRQIATAARQRHPGLGPQDPASGRLATPRLHDRRAPAALLHGRIALPRGLPESPAGHVRAVGGDRPRLRPGALRQHRRKRRPALVCPGRPP